MKGDGMATEQTNVEILKRQGELGNIRERLGAKNKDDESLDFRINKMSPKQLCEAFSGWHIGDGAWARDIISLYEALGGTEAQKRHGVV